MNKPIKRHKRSAQKAKGKNKKPERNPRSGVFNRKDRMDIAIQICGILVALLVIAMGIVAVSSVPSKFTVTLWLGFAAAVLTLLGGTLYWQKQHWDSVARNRHATTATAPELHGLLIPANDPTPDHGCGELPPNAVIVIMGKTGFVTERTAGTGTVNMNGLDLMTLARAEGGINISARVFSADNKVVAQITNNEFYVNPPEKPFQLKRPDWHTLIVYDSEGNESLYIRHSNTISVKVRGRFYVNGRLAVATDDSLILPGGIVFDGGCFSGFTSTGIKVG
jgi:hypothetical protein